MHTTYSDGRRNLGEYVAEAERKKIDEIGFSDHIYLEKRQWSMDHANLPKYVSDIETLREKSSISIKTGLEVDFIPDQMDNLMHLIRQWNPDYLIGSVHHIGYWLLDSEREIDEWKERNVDLVYTQYFNLVQTMAKTQLFDIVGHLDLVKKFGHRSKSDLTDLMLRTVETIGKSGMCIEINTSGLRKPCHEIYPSEKLLKMCLDNDIPITFGSDAHSPEDVGNGFDQAVALIQRVGYEEITRFTQRKRDSVSL
jgi:histidinol-phosphatase (PHP family)